MTVYEYASIFISFVAIIHEITNIKNHDFSFVIRYILVFFLFQDFQIFSNNIINYIFLDKISIGYIIYVISYKMVGAIMEFSSNYKRNYWKKIYFIIYIIVSLLLYFVGLSLKTKGYIPIK